MTIFSKRHIDLFGGDACLYTTQDPDIFPTSLFDYLWNETPWEQRSITIYGKNIPEPRQTCWYGSLPYSYSGRTQYPLPMTPMIEDLRDIVQDISGSKFNGVLLNLYTNGRDSVGYHSDNEPELGNQPVIASLSLGTPRKFVFKHISFFNSNIPIPPEGKSDFAELYLEHGDVLVMRGDTQKNWKHAVPKTKKIVGPRINLTFRNIVS